MKVKSQRRREEEQNLRIRYLRRREGQKEGEVRSNNNNIRNRSIQSTKPKTDSTLATSGDRWKDGQMGLVYIQLRRGGNSSNRIYIYINIYPELNRVVVYQSGNRFDDSQQGNNGSIQNNAANTYKQSNKDLHYLDIEGLSIYGRFGSKLLQVGEIGLCVELPELADVVYCIPKYLSCYWQFI